MNSTNLGKELTKNDNTETLKVNKNTPNNMDEEHKIPGEFSAALQAKCPRCRRGDMFNGPMYGLKLQKMNDACPHCKLRFEREPGYFYVAMFVSYALNVVEMITVGIATYLFTGNLENPFLYMATIFPMVFILSPFNFRFSRVALLYWMTPGLHYNPEMSESYPDQV